MDFLAAYLLSVKSMRANKSGLAAFVLYPEFIFSSFLIKEKWNSDYSVQEGILCL